MKHFYMLTLLLRLNFETRENQYRDILAFEVSMIRYLNKGLCVMNVFLEELSNIQNFTN